MLIALKKTNEEILFPQATLLVPWSSVKHNVTGKPSNPLLSIKMHDEKHDLSYEKEEKNTHISSGGISQYRKQQKANRSAVNINPVCLAGFCRTTLCRRPFQIPHVSVYGYQARRKLKSNKCNLSHACREMPRNRTVAPLRVKSSHSDCAGHDAAVSPKISNAIASKGSSKQNSLRPKSTNKE